MKTQTSHIISILLACMALLTVFSTSSAQTPTPPVGYYAVETKVLDDGTSVDLVVINGPPTPPPGFEMERTAVPDYVVASVTLLVPAYDWSYGCAATSAAMIAAYYDRASYPNMYTGSTNGGVMPMTNSVWGAGECPLSATHQGIDGRSTRGHVDDYWISYDSTGPDPWVGNWSEHTNGDCTGDYMETNKWYSAHSFNVDGGTIFFFYTSGAKLDATILEAAGPPDSYDGGVGVKQFYESRGYVVTAAYNQYIKGQGSNPSLGFTYDQYKAEIDAGRPVMIHVAGHTMVGVGYDDSSSNLMYIHDTWDYNTYTMIWGSTYQTMQHEGVTIVQLQSQNPDVGIVKQVVGGSDLVPGDPITFTLSIANSGGVVAANTVVTDVVPSEVLTPTFASTLAVTQTGVISYVWNIEPLGVGESGVITIYGWIDPSLDSDSSFGNTATIWDPEDNTPGNNTSSVTVGERKVYLPLVMKSQPQTGGVANGDFEDGPTGWTEYSMQGWDLIVTSFPESVTPHSGSWAVWLGGDDDEISYIQQQVTVPSGSPYLAYWHWIDSEDDCGYDFGGVIINGSTTVDVYDLCEDENTGGWVKHVVNLSAYAGQSISLQIRAETDSLFISNLIVDDVSFQASAASVQDSPPLIDPRNAAPKSGRNTPRGVDEEAAAPEFLFPQETKN